MLVVCMLDALSMSGIEIISSMIKVPSIRGAIIPPFSFEPDAAYLCGHYPEETNTGTHFWYKPTSSLYYVSGWIRLLDHLPEFAQLAARRWLRWRATCCKKPSIVKESITPARIPFKFIKYFAVANRPVSDSEGAYHFPTIFDLLRSKGKQWLYIGGPICGARLNYTKNAFKQGLNDEISLLFLSIGDLDEIGHRYGPASQQYESMAYKIAAFLREVIDYVEREAEREKKILVFGDHGMVPIKRFVDIEAALRKLPAKPVKDYIYFLDSTLARFWFINNESKRVIEDAIGSLEGGRLITEEERQIYRICYSHNRFGELIWWANGGTLILPNFWQGRKPVKGMHGYRREVAQNHAGFLLIDPELNGRYTMAEPLEMVDVFATMVDLLGLEMPEGAHGISIHKRGFF